MNLEWKYNFCWQAFKTFRLFKIQDYHRSDFLKFRLQNALKSICPSFNSIHSRWWLRLPFFIIMIIKIVCNCQVYIHFNSKMQDMI